MKYDIAIIGSGPAGLTSGIYASRGKLKTIIIEGDQPGGQLTTTTYIENWPGNTSISGYELMDNMKKHAQSCGAELLSDTIASVNFNKTPENLFTLTTQSNKIIQAKSIIIATGASSKRLGCPGEAEYFGKGVSTCATCDAPFYTDKEIVIIGGGDSAMTEAAHLAHFAKKITVIQNSHELTGKDPIKFKVLENPKVSFLYNSVVKEISGNSENVTHVRIKNILDNTETDIHVSGVFLAIGLKPNTGFLQNQIELDSYGYIAVRELTKTNIDG
ncbi:MAG: FAD-dependent oxidoreductase, partial [bacterium]